MDLRVFASSFALLSYSLGFLSMLAGCHTAVHCNPRRQLITREYGILFSVDNGQSIDRKVLSFEEAGGSIIESSGVLWNSTAYVLDHCPTYLKGQSFYVERKQITEKRESGTPVVAISIDGDTVTGMWYVDSFERYVIPTPILECSYQPLKDLSRSHLLRCSYIAEDEGRRRLSKIVIHSDVSLAQYHVLLLPCSTGDLHFTKTTRFHTGPAPKFYYVIEMAPDGESR